MIDEFHSFAAAPGRASLFGHGRQHLADVRGQEVVHFVALREEEVVKHLTHLTHSIRLICFSVNGSDLTRFRVSFYNVPLYLKSLFISL